VVPRVEGSSPFILPYFEKLLAKEAFFYFYPFLFINYKMALKKFNDFFGAAIPAIRSNP
jgi:hypothetical protein